MTKFLAWPDFFSNLSFEYTGGLFQRFKRLENQVTSVFPLTSTLLINLSKPRYRCLVQFWYDTNYSAVTCIFEYIITTVKELFWVTKWPLISSLLTILFCCFLSCFFLSLFPHHLLHHRHFVAYFSSYGSKIRRSMHLKKFWVSSFFGFGMILLLIMSNYNYADKFRLLQLQWQ